MTDSGGDDELEDGRERRLPPATDRFVRIGVRAAEDPSAGAAQ